MKNITSQRVTIASLLEGEVKTYLTEIVKDENTQVWAVAKEAESGMDWAAYHGHPALADCKESETPQDAAYLVWYAEHTNTPEGTLRFGDKLSEEEARALFKGEPWDALPYRP